MGVKLLSQNEKFTEVWGCRSVVDSLSRAHKTLASISDTAKEKVYTYLNSFFKIYFSYS